MGLVRRPSPAAWLLAALAAGIFPGLVLPIGPGALAWAAVLSGLLALVRPRWAVWIAAAGLGLGHGAVARQIERRTCRAVLPAGPAVLTVRLLDPSLFGGPVAARPEKVACGGAVALRFDPADTLLAGQRLRVTGRWIARRGGWTRDGTLVVERFELDGRDPSLVGDLRNWLGLTIGRLYGPRSGMIAALMIGTRGTIEPAMTQAFARSGLIHLLSISGFHVGLIGAWVVLIGRLLGRRRLRAQLAAVIVVAGYVGFIGAPPPALRAAVLAALGLVEAWRQRAVAPGPLFAVTATIVLLFDPWALVDLGAWFSVTALWGATAATQWSDRALSPAPGWRIVAGSIGATAMTAPVSALTLGSVSLIGIPLNLAGIPLAAVAVPGVAATLIAAPLAPDLAASMAAGSGIALGVLEALALGGAKLEAAALTFEPGWGRAAAASAVVAGLLFVVGRRNTAREAARRAGWIGAVWSVASLLVALPFRSHGGSRATLHFLDVGQGDAALIETPAHRWILIDAGPWSDRRDAGARVVVPYLARRGVDRLDLVVVSHGHLDHYGGSRAVFAAMPVGLVAEPGGVVTDPGYLDWLGDLDRMRVPWRPLHAGTRFTIDGITLDVLHPDTTWSGAGLDLNDDSVVLRVRAGRFEALFPGDAGFRVEERLAGRIGRVELLKVGHHGSRTSTGARLLAETAPRVAVVSTGPNRYGHPSPEALGRLARAEVDLWRTDRDGTVRVEVFDSTMRVSGRSRTRIYPVR